MPNGGVEGNAELERALDTFVQEAERHQTRERNLATKVREHLKQPKGLFEAIGLLVAAVVGAFNVALWVAQLQANSINQKALIYSNRPWIKVTVFPSDLSWFQSKGDFSGLSFSPHIVVKNFGHTPAVGVRVFFSGLVNGSILDAQKQACANVLSRSHAPSWSRLVFPDETKDLSSDGIATDGFYIPEKELDAAMSAQTEKTGTVVPIIYGCVDYTFGSPPVHYQTTFAYYLWRVVKHIGSGGLIGGFMPNQNVGADDTRMEEIPEANNAN